MNAGSSELKVGIFVTAALLIGGVIVFVIGDRSAMFASRASYRAEFEAVDGLRRGSPVRVAGIEVGTVDSIDFAQNGHIVVGLSVRNDTAGFVREGSTARIASKGLLGDQLVEISVGDGEALAVGSTIPTSEESLLAGFLGDTGRDAEGIVRNVNRVSEGLADPQFQEDLAAIAHNLASLTALATENDGTVRRLLTDPELADNLSATLSSFRQTADELRRASRSVRSIVGEVQNGDGTAHELIYGQDGLTLIANLANAASQLALILTDVRTGDGNAHELIYGDGAGNLVRNLTAASTDLRAIVADVRAGRGTLGGLLTDPSIYEDIKRLVGNLQRNEILRSLVRYSIREDEARPQRPRPDASE